MRERAASVEANRTAILDAAAELGDPRLTLAEIAEHAGVSTRTILRHFGSRAELSAAAIEHAERAIRDERFQSAPGDVTGAVSDLVAHYERRGDAVIARLAEEGRDPAIDELIGRGREVHREWVGEKLGPLLDSGLTRSERRRRLAQLIAICDVYTWKLLRRDIGLGVAETETALAEMISGLTEGGHR